MLFLIYVWNPTFSFIYVRKFRNKSVNLEFSPEIVGERSLIILSKNSKKKMFSILLNLIKLHWRIVKEKGMYLHAQCETQFCFETALTVRVSKQFYLNQSFFFSIFIQLISKIIYLLRRFDTVHCTSFCACFNNGILNCKNKAFHIREVFFIYQTYSEIEVFHLL